MKQLAATLVLALLAVAAHAKCIDLTYLLEGQVADEANRPAAGAMVGASWLEAGGPAGPAIAITDNQGRYHLSVRFHRNDDMPLVGGACKERLKRISFVAYLGDQRSSPAQVPISGRSQKLPDIKIIEPAASPW